MSRLWDAYCLAASWQHCVTIACNVACEEWANVTKDKNVPSPSDTGPAAIKKATLRIREWGPKPMKDCIGPRQGEVGTPPPPPETRMMPVG